MNYPTAAIDIECVPRGESPEFDGPAGHWETFVISAACTPTPDGGPESAVFVRRDGSDDARRHLLAATANWLRTRAPQTIITYNGKSFDMPILNDHIDAISDEQLAEYLRDQLHKPDHRDLFGELVERRPENAKWPSLSESVREFGIDAPVTKLDGDVVDGGLMPALGARILRGEGLGERERFALQKYARTDVTPLEKLARAIDNAPSREERIRAEADAVTGGGR